jgi:hypothetical protein
MLHAASMLKRANTELMQTSAYVDCIEIISTINETIERIKTLEKEIRE